jgi:hypothetical protein
MPCPKPTRLSCAALCACAVLVLYAPADALAAASGGGSAIGANLGHLLGTWARSLFGGVIALVSVVFLVNRRYNDLALFVGAAVLVGGLIYSTATVASVIRSIWTTLGA